MQSDVLTETSQGLTRERVVPFDGTTDTLASPNVLNVLFPVAHRGTALQKSRSSTDHRKHLRSLDAQQHHRHWLSHLIQLLKQSLWPGLESVFSATSSGMPRARCEEHCLVKALFSAC